MSLKNFLNSSRRVPYKRNGFAGMGELVIASGVGTLLIIASGVALQSTGTLIKQSEEKTTLRQNSINGLRLMRSEVERSTHLVLKRPVKDNFSEEQAHINLRDDRYSSLLSDCKNLAAERPFKPIFGVKMVELTQPVLYGVSLAREDIVSNVVEHLSILMVNIMKLKIYFYHELLIILELFPAVKKVS